MLNRLLQTFKREDYTKYLDMEKQLFCSDCKMMCFPFNDMCPFCGNKVLYE